MKIAVVDNYDSFTYNLVSMIESISGSEVEVFRNDKISGGVLNRFDRIVLSPGPGLPAQAGYLNKAIEEYAASKSIFGVCLGLQAIAEVFGCDLKNLKDVHHGVSSEIIISEPGDYLFKGFRKTFEAGRYHSWVVSNSYIPNDLLITAVDGENEIMAMRHKDYDISGVQFHPESVLTPMGGSIIKNWLFEGNNV